MNKTQIIELMDEGTPAAALKLLQGIGLDLVSTEKDQLSPNDGVSLEEFADQEHGGVLNAFDNLVNKSKPQVIGEYTLEYIGNSLGLPNNGEDERTDNEKFSDVFKLTVFNDDKTVDRSVYLRVVGYYSSYDGSLFDKKKINFVNKYKVAVEKFYTVSERNKSSDEFI